MRAVRQHTLGGPEVLVVEEVPKPEPAPTEVLVRVAAAGVNPVDWKVRAGGGLLGEPPFTVGWDVAGTVEEVGFGVTWLAPGDRVFGMPRFPQEAACYAEYVVSPSRQLARTPEALADVEAAAVPLAGLTAWQSLVDTGGVGEGSRVLVLGAAGGVGHFAVQIASRARGLGGGDGVRGQARLPPGVGRGRGARQGRAHRRFATSTSSSTRSAARSGSVRCRRCGTAECSSPSPARRFRRWWRPPRDACASPGSWSSPTAWGWRRLPGSRPRGAPPARRAHVPARGGGRGARARRAGPDAREARAHRLMARFVLVHGAFGGAWSWEPVVGPLEAAGHTVEALDLPGGGKTGLPSRRSRSRAAPPVSARYSSRVRSRRFSSGYSMGGVVVTQAASDCPRAGRVTDLRGCVHAVERPVLLELTASPGRRRTT